MKKGTLKVGESFLEVNKYTKEDCKNLSELPLKNRWAIILKTYRLFFIIVSPDFSTIPRKIDLKFI